MPSSRRRLAIVAALAFACDTGYSLHTTVTIPEDIAAAYSEANPGMLIVRFDPTGFDPTLRSVAVICGDAGSFRVNGGGDGDIPDTIVRAWIEPAPGQPCGSSNTFFEEGDYYIDEDEPQARGMVEEKTGCAGHDAEIELTLALPPAK